jgi:CENP-B N-terminal DNA-binding domain
LTVPLIKEKVGLKRKAVTLEIKIKMLDRLRKGEKLGTVAKKFNLNESTVRIIRDNEEKIQSNVVLVSAISAKRVCQTRNPVMEIMEKRSDNLDRGQHAASHTYERPLHQTQSSINPQKTHGIWKFCQ